VTAGAVALAVAAGGFAFLVATYREAPTDGVAGALDPDAICDVPAYDPDVALLVGQPVREVALADLEAPGQPASELEGPGTDALRAYLASPAAVHAPGDGWRPIGSSEENAVFVAPDDQHGSWWVVGFVRQPDGDWRQVEEEIVEQELTAAQRGHGLQLAWDGTLHLDEGAWNDPLRLVNDRDTIWTDTGNEHRGIPHVFDRATGQEIVAPLPLTGWSGDLVELAAGQSIDLPVALGALLSALVPGSYDVVACVPSLGLASPVGTLDVTETGAIPDVRVLTYPSSGAGMAALGGGTLIVANGCLAVGDTSQPIYVLWPDGYALVERDGAQMLIDPIGENVGAIGDDVTLGGGFVELRWIADMLSGDLPADCRAPGESYFVTSGLAETGG
jgi:hypothetical protein